MARAKTTVLRCVLTAARDEQGLAATASWIKVYACSTRLEVAPKSLGMRGGGADDKHQVASH